MRTARARGGTSIFYCRLTWVLTQSASSKAPPAAWERTLNRLPRAEIWAVKRVLTFSKGENTTAIFCVGDEVQAAPTPTMGCLFGFFKRCFTTFWPSPSSQVWEKSDWVYFKGRILFGEDLKIIMDVKHVIVDLCWVLGVCRWLMIFFFFFWRVYVCFCSLQKSRYTASNCTRACEKKQKKLVHFCFINLGGYFFLSF